MDGVQAVVARRVASAGFAISGKILAFRLKIEAGVLSTESMSLYSYPRMLQ